MLINQSNRWGIGARQSVNVHTHVYVHVDSKEHLVVWSPTSCDHLCPMLRSGTHTIVYFVVLSVIQLFVDINLSHLQSELDRAS